MTVSELILTGVATGVISLTITRSKIFLVPRLWVGEKLGDWAWELVRCPYCMSHWIAAGLVAWNHPQSIHEAVLQWLASIAIAAPTGAIVYWSIQTVHPLASEATNDDSGTEQEDQSASVHSSNR